ncbi:MAG: Transcriptional regulatory protein ZraR, partial [Planctomycetota bacterium]
GRYAKELGRQPMPVTQAAMMRLTAYDWPGNVRELMMVVHRMVVTAAGDQLDVGDVPEEIRAVDRDEPDAPAAVPAGGLAGLDMAQLEKEAIRQTLARTQGNREQAAQLLGIGERTLYRKIKDYGLR